MSHSYREKKTWYQAYANCLSTAIQYPQNIQSPTLGNINVFRKLPVFSKNVIKVFDQTRPEILGDNFLTSCILIIRLSVFLNYKQ